MADGRAEQRTREALDWEPDQSKHGMSCGIQGSHSGGAGQRGQCTCGRDELLRETRNVLIEFALWISPVWEKGNLDDEESAAIAVDAFLDEEVYNGE